jgi:hypothetical protein
MKEIKVTLHTEDGYKVVTCFKAAQIDDAMGLVRNYVENGKKVTVERE